MSRSGAILVVDDDDDFIEIVRHALERAGLTVRSACGAEQAWGVLTAEPIALIVSDLMMGSLDEGFKFAARVKGQPRLAAVPIILTTSAASVAGFDFNPRSPDELKAMNVDAFLPKPIRSTDLLDKVRELLA